MFPSHTTICSYGITMDYHCRSRSRSVLRAKARVSWSRHSWRSNSTPVVGILPGKGRRIFLNQSEGHGEIHFLNSADGDPKQTKNVWVDFLKWLIQWQGIVIQYTSPSTNLWRVGCYRQWWDVITPQENWIDPTKRRLEVGLHNLVLSIQRIWMYKKQSLRLHIRDGCDRWNLPSHSEGQGSIGTPIWFIPAWRGD